MAKRITNANEITDLNKSYILGVPQSHEPKQQKKDNIHLSKRTKKDILEHPNKIKNKSKMGSLPPDVEAMQADIEFIKQQLQKEKQVNKKNTRKNRLNINLPLSFYGQPMRPVKNDIARTSKKAINNQKDKNNIKGK